MSNREPYLRAELARYTAALELYSEIGLHQDDFALTAALLSSRLKYIADVRQYRFVAVDLSSHERGNPVFVLADKSFHRQALDNIDPAELEMLRRNLPVEYLGDGGAAGWPFDVLSCVGSGRRVSAVIARRVDSVAGALIVSHDGQLAAVELKLLGGVSSFLCKSVATYWRELGYVEALRASNDELKQLVSDLSTVISPIAERALLAPIVGRLDVERTSQLLERLLARVSAQSVEHVILDLTGVSTVDEGSSRQLTRICTTLGLLGARCIMVGLSGKVARAFVEAGQMPSSAVFCSNLKNAIRLLPRATPDQRF